MRWKGYGPEADTWQPIADLANVQDMIDDFKKEKALKLQQKVEKVSHIINEHWFDFHVFFFFLNLRRYEYQWW